MESKVNSERVLAVNVVKEKIKKHEYIFAAQFVYDTDYKYEFPIVLKKQVLAKGAKCYLQKGDYESAFFLFNRLHRINPKSKTTFKNLVSTLESIWNKYESIVGSKGANYFTVDDAVKFSTSLSILINYHIINFPDHRHEIEKGKQLLIKVEYTKKHKAIESKDPKKEIESVVSFRIKKIYDSIYEEMTLDQVYQEAARILAPTIREILAEEETEKKSDKEKSKKGKSKKKPKKP